MSGGCYRRGPDGARTGYAADWDAATEEREQRRAFWAAMRAAVVAWARDNDYPVWSSDEVDDVLRPLWNEEQARPGRTIHKSKRRGGGDYQFSSSFLMGKLASRNRKTFIAEKEGNRMIYALHPHLVRQGGQA